MPPSKLERPELPSPCRKSLEMKGKVKVEQGTPSPRARASPYAHRATPSPLATNALSPRSPTLSLSIPTLPPVSGITEIYCFPRTTPYSSGKDRDMAGCQKRQRGGWCVLRVYAVGRGRGLPRTAAERDGAAAAAAPAHPRPSPPAPPPPHHHARPRVPFLSQATLLLIYGNLSSFWII